MMKTRMLLVAVLLTALVTPLWADNMADRVELDRSVIRTEKKAIIAKNMNFTEMEAEAFWPVYHKFQQAIRPVYDRKVKLIMTYAKDYEKLSDKEANNLVKDYLRIQKDQVKVKQHYVRKFNNVMPSKKVARYYQLEQKMDAVIDAELAANIPLVR